MATTTPNYGWTVPTSTDLVKDGATAIETLGDAIDASMNTALGTKKAGMVLLNTTSFSAVASQSAPASTFTSTYKNYVIKFYITAKSTGAVQGLRLRASGTDSTGSDYFRNSPYFRASSTTVSGGWAANTSMEFGQFSNDGICVGTVELFNPQQALKTPYLLDTMDTGSTTNQNTRSFTYGIHNLTTAYDSFTFITGSGTITGSFSVFGWNE
jgi:hypothetical protein